MIHLIQALREDFSLSSLDEIKEDEAANKQLFLYVSSSYLSIVTTLIIRLYKNSRHTFISMTAQRSRYSSAPSTLFPSAVPQEVKAPALPTSSVASRTAVAPSTPTRKGHVRINSGLGSLMDNSEDKEGTIRFRQLDLGEEHKLRADIQNRYGPYDLE